jgi:hypothetical protein
MWRRRTQTQLLFEGAAHPAGGSGALPDERIIAVESLSREPMHCTRNGQEAARVAGARGDRRGGSDEGGRTLAMRAIAVVDQGRQRGRQSSQPCAEAAWRGENSLSTSVPNLIAKTGQGRLGLLQLRLRLAGRLATTVSF